MNSRLTAAFGYQGDKMALPVADVDVAVPFYERVLGFRVASRANVPHRSAVLDRDGIQIGLVESGGDSSQDGCAFHVTDVEALFREFKANGLKKGDPGTEASSTIFDLERHDDATFKVFYVVAPDGLCYWFGERQPAG
jgi:lactoylglutathione lyase